MKWDMKAFGMTGGIGMGKSAAGQWLRNRGVPTVDTDMLAHEITEPGQPALVEIQQVFGNEMVGLNGRLDRARLADLVFSDAGARRELEGILHPRIRELWKRQLEVWRSDKKPAAVVIIPLLFETGAEKELDATICVACSAATQRRRLLERGWNPEQIEQRIAAQWPVEKKIAAADYVVWTEGSLEVMSEQLERIVFKTT